MEARKAKAVAVIGLWMVAGSAVGSCSAGTSAAHSISGTVSGVVASGVTLNLAGAATASTTTDTSGSYRFAGLSDGSDTLTPMLAGYSFSPSTFGVTVSGADVTGKSFTAHGSAQTYSISGTVSGAVASGVTVSLAGAASATATTDGSGTYQFTGLANGSYTVTPDLSGYSFSPSALTVTKGSSGSAAAESSS